MHIHLTNEPSDLPSCVDVSLNWGTMHFTAVKTHPLLRESENYRNGLWCPCILAWPTLLNPVPALS